MKAMRSGTALFSGPPAPLPRPIGALAEERRVRRRTSPRPRTRGHARQLDGWRAL